MADHSGFNQDLNAALAIAFQDAEDDFALDRHGMVTIDFEGHGEVVVQAMPENGTALLSATVCPVPRDDADLLRRALATNLFGISPPGAFLAYDAEKSVLTLCQSTGAQVCSPEGLMDCLTAFVSGIGTARRVMLAPPSGADGAVHFGSGVSDIIISG